jgi:hypothetical protein
LDISWPWLAYIILMQENQEPHDFVKDNALGASVNNRRVCFQSATE